MQTHKVQRGNLGFVSEFFTDAFVTLLKTVSKYEAFNAKNFGNLPNDANENKTAINEDTLRKLGKEEIIKLALEYQPKFDSTLSSTRVIKTDV